MREKEREESKENMKNTREKNNKTQKRNNVNSSSSLIPDTFYYNLEPQRFQKVEKRPAEYKKA